MKYFVIVMIGFVLSMNTAFAENWEVSGSIGKAVGDVNTSDLNERIVEQGLNVTASSSNQNRTAWQLLLGYHYTPEWGLEFGYVDLGKVSTKLQGSTADIDALLSTVSDIHPLTAHGWQLTGNYRYPIESSAAIVLRAGLFNWRSKYKLETTAASYTVTGSGSSAVIGAGIEKVLDQNKKLNVNFYGYDLDGELITLVNVGLTVSLK